MSFSFKNHLIATVCMSAAVLFCSQDSVFAQEPLKKWDGHVEFEYRDGNDRNIGEAELFIPVHQSEDAMVFVDIRGMLDNQSSEEGNVGIGYRKILDDKYLGQKWIVGGYGFADVRSTKANNKFYQATIGAEALSEDWDLRTNVYIPESSEDTVAGTANVSAAVIGTEIRLTGTDNIRERALPGIDAEVGFKLPVFEDRIDALRIYGGGFHFDADGYENVSGPRGRLEMSWDNVATFGENSRLTLGAEVQHDDVRDTTAFGIARLRIPFQTFNNKIKRPSLSPLEKRMTETIVRDVDIVSGQETVAAAYEENATVTINGVQISNVTMLDAGDNIPAQITAAGAGATILIDGSQGQIDLNTQIVLQNNQVISGAGLVVTGSSSGIQSVLGSRPTITDNGIAGATDTIAFPAGGVTARLENVDIVSNNFGDAIDISTSAVANLDQISINGGDNGIAVVTGTLNLSNSIIENTNADGINGTVVAMLNVDDSIIRNTGTIGINALGFNTGFPIFLNVPSNLTVNNTSIQNPGTIGVRGFISTSDISNTHVSDAGTDSFAVTSSVLSGTGNTSTNPGAADCNNGGFNAGSFVLNAGTCP